MIHSFKIGLLLFTEKVLPFLIKGGQKLISNTLELFVLRLRLAQPALENIAPNYQHQWIFLGSNFLNRTADFRNRKWFKMKENTQEVDS